MPCRSGRTRRPSGRRSAAAPEHRLSLPGVALLLLAGCATTVPLPPVAPGGDTTHLCRGLFERVDAAVEHAGVIDAGARRIEDFPWLRLTRPLASFRFELDTAARRAAWLERLGQADTEGRQHELANLSADRRARLERDWRGAAAGSVLPVSLRAGLTRCRERLNRALADDREHMERLATHAAPFDAYRDWQRVVGLYPLTRHVVLPRIATHQSARRDAIRRGVADRGTVRRYAVPAPAAVPAVRPSDLDRDALGIPRPTDDELAALFSAHAPVWSVETRTAADLPGALVAGSSRPETDGDHPAEYRRWSWTRFRGRVLVQLSYLVWFPERPPEDSVDIYAGHLDGLIWRVTLRDDGTPLAYETIHPCGCFYTVFPAEGWRVNPPAGSEPVLAPVSAPVVDDGERTLVHLEARTHYVAGVSTASPGARDTIPLAPLPLASLRSLPREDGSRTSAFAPDGLIPSTRRTERFLLWPLGVASPGAMRQWGTHAIAFVGKRHFDDPFLLDRLLEAE